MSLKALRILGALLFVIGITMACTEDNSDQALYNLETNTEASEFAGCPDGSCSNQCATCQ